METGLIYQRMAAVMKETKAIGKSELNRQQGFKFRGIDNVMNELHEAFARNEIFVLQEVIDYTVDERQSKSGGVNAFTRARVRFSYVTTDGSMVQTTNVGEAMDSGDKGMNKAMSVALKYSLLQMLLIPTEDEKDPDYQSPELAPREQPKKPAEKKILTMSQLQDPGFMEKVCAWIGSAETKAKAKGERFSMAAFVERTYTVTNEEINFIGDAYESYKVNNNI